MSITLTESKTPKETPRAALITLRDMRETLLPAWFSTIPANATLRAWLKHVPSIKARPSARRGGGVVYYSRVAVEKMLREMLGGK